MITQTVKALKSKTLHLRLEHDYRTVCGRLCENWQVVENGVFLFVQSEVCCKLCLEGL
jgi:hypothetical protein